MTCNGLHHVLYVLLAVLLCLAPDLQAAPSSVTPNTDVSNSVSSQCLPGSTNLEASCSAQLSGDDKEGTSSLLIPAKHELYVREPYRVLAVLLPWKSRMFSVLRVLAELETRGNSITMLVPRTLQKATLDYLRYLSNTETIPSGFSFILYDGAPLEDIAGSRPDPMGTARMVSQLMGAACKSTMAALREADLIHQPKFQVLFADVVDNCRVNVADYLGIPRIDYDSSACGLYFAYSEYNAKLPTSYMPAYGSNLTYDVRQWNSLHRLKNFVQLQILNQVVSHFMHPPILEVRKQENISGSFIESKKNNVLLTIVAADWCFQPVWNAPPLLKFVGPLLPHPPKPLAPVLDAFVNEGLPHGALVVSFGTAFVPDLELQATLMRALQQLPFQVVWKMTEHDQARFAQHLSVSSLNEFSSKFTFLPWLDQNGLIGHPSVKGIITHGGINSLYETVWHGKPLVAVPLSADQFENAKWLEFEGVGRWLHESWWTDVNAGIVLELLKDVFGNPKYTQAAQAKSRCMRSHKNTAGERAADWFDYAIANAPHKLFHSEDTRLSLVVSNGWDVCLLLTVIALTVCYVAACLLKSCVLKLARILPGSRSDKADCTVICTLSDDKDKVE